MCCFMSTEVGDLAMVVSPVSSEVLGLSVDMAIRLVIEQTALLVMLTELSCRALSQGLGISMTRMKKRAVGLTAQNSTLIVVL